MPPQPGEVSLLTLFSDVHYYFSPPSYPTPHHRFDKSSYVYLYHNPIQQRGRIEIANHAGTPGQDAFAGDLDTVKIEQSYKHPCLFTITVDAFRSHNGSASSSPHQDMSQWHLPSPDPNNNGKYMYRLHTVDIYLWTQEDASLFLDSLRRVAQPHQLHILANPQTPSHPPSASAPSPAEHRTDAMSPLIAKLERAAVSHSTSPGITNSHSFPGPPSAPPPTSSSPPTSDPNQNFTPMAYNPAAPPAPEPIAHREKTPPPPDAADGTGLATAAMNDHAQSHHHQQHQQQYANPLQTSFAPQPTSSQPYLPGPPSRSSTFSATTTASLQHQHQQQQPHQRTNSIPPPPQSPPSFAPPPSAPPQYDHAAAPTNPPKPSHSVSPLPSPSYTPQYQPIGGYANYTYGSTTAQAGSTGATDPYALHQEVYRPTESEASVVHHERPGPSTRSSNIGKRAEKVEKGVGKFLKKLDKKF